MENRCIIVSGGVFSPAPEQQPGDFVIACDRGYAYCERLGLMPDLFIGDFDSYSGAVAPGVAVERLIPEKDDTDTGHAITYALAHGFRTLVLTCALGGRLDHTIANLQMLRLLADADTAGILIDAGHRVTLQRGGMWNSRQVYRKPQTGKWYLSLFAMTPVCEGITSAGVAYPLEHGTLRASYPLGVSNEILGEQAEISVEKGDLLVVQAKNV